MTRAEAIKIIERAKAEAEWEKSLEYQIAFDMAIEALKGVDDHCRAERIPGRRISDGESSGKGGWVD